MMKSTVSSKRLPQVTDTPQPAGKRRRLTGQPLITAFVRTTSPSTVPVIKAPFTLATLARRSAAPPSDQAELSALARKIVPLPDRIEEVPIRSLIRESTESGQDPSKRDLEFTGGRNIGQPWDFFTACPGKRMLSILDINILGGYWNSPGEIAELLLLPHAAPIVLKPYLVPDLANIVCSYLEPSVCYDPMPTGTLVDGEYWRITALGNIPLLFFPLHEHAYWTMVYSEDARALHGDIVFKEAVEAEWLESCSYWSLVTNAGVLGSMALLLGDQDEADLLDRYMRMYWTFVELRLNAGLKAVFEHVAHRLNSFFSIPQGLPPSNEWPFLVRMPSFDTS